MRSQLVLLVVLNSVSFVTQRPKSHILGRWYESDRFYLESATQGAKES